MKQQRAALEAEREQQQQQLQQVNASKVQGVAATRDNARKAQVGATDCTSTGTTCVPRLGFVSDRPRLYALDFDISQPGDAVELVASICRWRMFDLVVRDESRALFVGIEKRILSSQCYGDHAALVASSFDLS